ncbi:MAG: F0F1 ATP synthase subunit epsilon [Planctomycetota bacterium]
MRLRILLPFHVFAEVVHVTRIGVETNAGAFGLLPLRLDCCAALVPGILTYETLAGSTVFVAIDEGVMVKAGREVLVSVRGAVGGSSLAELRDLIEAEYLDINVAEREARSAMARLESGFLRRFAALHYE